MINVYINPANKNKTSPLVATVSISGTRYKYPVGISVNTLYWNPKKQKAKENDKYLDDAILINSRIETISAAISSAAAIFVAQASKPTSAQFSSQVRALLKPVLAPSMLFVPFIENYYPTMNRSKESVKKIITTINKLKQFETLNHTQLSFHDIDVTFYNDFSRFFISNDYSMNYFGSIIRLIRFFFSTARDLKLHDLALPKSFTGPNVTADSIYLSTDELLKIHNLLIDEKLILNKLGTKVFNVFGNIERMILSLNDCKHRFLIGCFTGLRFSDYSLISDLKHTDSYITKTSLKTNVKSIIPMHYVIRDILLSRNNQLPKPVSNQKMNKQLKILGFLAGINEQIEITTILVSGKSQLNYKKHELITTHTARRSFCTNAYLQGIDTLSIMSFSGHKTTTSFLKYIKASQFQIATKLLNHPFFILPVPVLKKSKAR